jgi:hypothetical protein
LTFLKIENPDETKRKTVTNKATAEIGLSIKIENLPSDMMRD